MSSPYATAADSLDHARPMPPIHRAEHPAHASAVSWGAIVAGAAAAAALSMILLILGAGLGLSAISPWSRSGASAASPSDRTSPAIACESNGCTDTFGRRHMKCYSNSPSSDRGPYDPRWYGRW